MTAAEIREHLIELRRLEDQFYRTVLNETDVYMLAIRLVRAIADSLQPVADLAALIERYQRTSADDVIPIAEALEAPQVVMLDYQLALGAAFYLRAQEIQEANAQAEVLRRLAAARAQGQRWAVVYDHERKRYGKSLFQRLEMRLSDGFSLYAASELDMEKGLVHALEPMWLDPATGKQRPETPPPELRQEYATREAMLEAVEALRRKYP